MSYSEAELIKRGLKSFVDTAIVKELNKKALRKHLAQKREATIQELSKLTALSVVTVKTLLAQMIEKGEVSEGRFIPSRGGRPSQLFAYNGEHRHAVVIYGYQKDNRNSIHILVVNLFGECVYKKQTFLDDIQVDSFCGMLDNVIQAYPDVTVIAFGLPGFEENGVIVANDYSGIVGNRFMPFYQARYELPVIFSNDVNAAVKGYAESFADSPCLVGIYFPRIYSPGAGMVLGGDVYTGSQHFAGEIGQLLPDTDWTQLDYSDGQTMRDTVSRLLSIYCRILAPHQFVLYGDFFSVSDTEIIKQKTQSLLNGQFRVNVTLSSAFEADFERGMIVLALSLINERNLLD